MPDLISLQRNANQSHSPRKSQRFRRVEASSKRFPEVVMQRTNARDYKKHAYQKWLVPVLHQTQEHMTPGIPERSRNKRSASHNCIDVEPRTSRMFSPTDDVQRVFVPDCLGLRSYSSAKRPLSILGANRQDSVVVLCEQSGHFILRAKLRRSYHNGHVRLPEARSVNLVEPRSNVGHSAQLPSL